MMTERQAHQFLWWFLGILSLAVIVAAANSCAPPGTIEVLPGTEVVVQKPSQALDLEWGERYVDCEAGVVCYYTDKWTENAWGVGVGCVPLMHTRRDFEVQACPDLRGGE